MMKLFSLLCIAISFAGHTCINQYKYELNASVQYHQPDNISYVDMNAFITIKHFYHDNEVSWFGLKADQTNLKVNGVLSPSNDYEIPFLFGINTKGSITEFKFISDTPENVKEKLKGFAYYFQTHKVSKENPLVTTLERDAMGEYLVTYKMDEPYIEKNKVSYKESIDIKKSITRYQLGKCFYNELTASEKVEITDGPIYKSIETNTDYTFSTNRPILDSPLLTLSNTPDDWLIIKAKPLSKADKKELQEQLKLLLPSLNITQLASTELAELLKKYSPILGEVETVTLLLNEMALEDEQYMRLFNSIGQIENAASQMFLVNTINHEEINDTHKFRAIMSLLQGTEELTPSALYALGDAVLNNQINRGELQPILVTAVGGIVDNRKNAGDTLVIQDAIIQGLHASESNKDKVTYLTAVGNMKNSNHLDYLTPYIYDGTANVRAATIMALGKINNPEAYNIVVENFNNEKNEYVQITALKALSNYKVDSNFKTKAIAIAASNSNSEIRRSAIELLTSKENKLPNKDLRKMLKFESDKSNYRLIVNALRDGD
ncbi:HEAT repeat domain-containing protein [Pseudoalteromonas shioyasakiensis]|uniref:HEAT repeat domain-containing protein n=1 Tax=Pseudoalteromonas shioyasakiensis TaxID=1190813 RepID=UPI0021177160|nr:HEAT repeat domain-containing protein [Pseudoalteromonas shioyasakiensis]MCQ8880025.1 HEAT repeat domain-containing protein [Pseudoalteromonas shioyasakiensis]